MNDRLASWVERLRLPVVCAPMFLVTGVDLVVAACRAGIVGALPTLNARTPEQLEAWCREIRAQLDAGPAAPWAVNVVVHSSNVRLEQDLEIALRYRPDCVITALGSPRAVVESAHRAGSLVFADVATPTHARKAIEAGVDGLVLVTTGAGGHQGPLAMPAFVGEVRQFWTGPLMVAGTIANGAALRSALTLGADLVYIGTPFIATPESLASQPYKDLVATSSARDIILSNAFTGAHANYLRPSIVAAGLDPDALKPKGSIDAIAAQQEVKAWKTIWAAGQAVGQVTAVEPVAVKVARLEAEFRAAIAGERKDPWSRKFGFASEGDTP